MRSAISTLAMLRYRVRAPGFVRSSSSCWRRSRQRVPTRLDSLPFPAPPICRQIAHHAAYSFRFWSGRMNSASLACDSTREKSIGTMGRCMSFVVFERKNGNFSVLQPCFGMPGGVILPMICHGSVFCLIRGCVVNYWLSAFEREIWAGEFQL